MATVSSKRARPIEYPTSDGKPMAETEYHRDLMMDLIRTLKTWFARKPKMYISGNLLMYYEPGNKRKHVSPDVFVVPGVSKKKRFYYLTWEEGKNPADAGTGFRLSMLRTIRPKRKEFVFGVSGRSRKRTPVPCTQFVT